MNLPVMEINVGVELGDKSSGFAQVLSLEKCFIIPEIKIEANNGQ